MRREGWPMKVKMILPAPAEALTTSRRSIKFSRFPPLGLPALAAFLNPDDEVTLQDEHVERLDLDDRPDLVALQVYVTSAFRAYAIADEYRKRGTYVAMGGLHPTSCPEEALRHADSVFQGPGEDTWPAFLRDFHAGRPKPLYRSRVRCLVGVPPARDSRGIARLLRPGEAARRQRPPHTRSVPRDRAGRAGGGSADPGRQPDPPHETATIPWPPSRSNS